MAPQNFSIAGSLRFDFCHLVHTLGSRNPVLLIPIPVFPNWVSRDGNVCPGFEVAVRLKEGGGRNRL